MTLRFLAKDPGSDHGNSPTVWEDGDSYVVQALLAPLVASGGDLRRLRTVSEPITEYVRYEYDVTPFANLAGGEVVRWLPRDRASDLRFPGNDFWLIDDWLLFSISSGDGEWLGVQPNDDPRVIGFCAESFEAAWRRAIDYSDYRPI